VKAPTGPQQRALRLLAPNLPPDAYLAGGVAVAVRLGHRVSHDLDVFTVDSDPLDLVEALATRGDVRITSRGEGTLYLEADGVPVSIIRHRYPLVTPAELVEPLPIPVASVSDLTAMKLHAIASRGAARDFWDLHELLVHRSLSLTEALDEHSRRYPNEDAGHVLRSLAYFGDAEAAPLPSGLSRDKWESIRLDFEAWTRDV
jgi:Nucleotidyl transferase AbiEii toxin, Type IV TA system